MGIQSTRKEKKIMSGEFKGFAKPADDKKFHLYLRNNEINKFSILILII